MLYLWFRVTIKTVIVLLFRQNELVYILNTWTLDQHKSNTFKVLHISFYTHFDNMQSLHYCMALYKMLRVCTLHLKIVLLLANGHFRAEICRNFNIIMNIQIGSIHRRNSFFCFCLVHFIKNEIICSGITMHLPINLRYF